MGIFIQEFTGTDNVAMSAGNSGSGGNTAVNAVVNAFYSATRAVVGSSSVRLEQDGQEAQIRWALGTIRDFAFRYYVWMPADPVPGDTGLLRLSYDNAGSEAVAMTVYISSVAGDVLRLRGGAETLWTAEASFPTEQWVRLEGYVQQGTGVDTGQIQFAYYLGDSTTPIEAPSTFTGVSLGGDIGQLVQWRIGKLSPTTYPGIWMDSLKFHTDTDATGLVGPPENAAPTVDAGANQNVAAASTVNLSATGSDSDGSIAGYSWSFLYPATGAPTLAGATTATPSFTSGVVGSLYVLQCQVSDALGATGTDTVEVRVPKSGAFSTVPMDGAPSGPGTWARAGSATTDGAALADASDATYVESPEFSVILQAEEFRLEPLVPRESLQLTVRTAVTDVAGTVSVQLREGVTVRQSWTLTPGTSAGDTTLTVTNPAAISDWSDLRVRFSVVA